MRTEEIAGHTQNLPEVGKSFYIIGYPMTEESAARLLITTKVKEIRNHRKESSLEFWTNNSHYGLQILDMDTVGTIN